MFKFEEKIISNQMALLMEFSQSYALYRGVSEFLKSNPMNLEYWVHLNNISVNDLIIKWCKIFGTDDNKTHWKKASHTAGFPNFVRSRIVNTCFESNFEAWKDYRQEMINFRNNYSAHRDLGNFSEVPFLQMSFQTAACFFNFLVDDFGPWASRQPYLVEYFEKHKLLVECNLKTNN